MASKALREAVRAGEGGTWDFACPVLEGRGLCGFTSTRWPSRQAAEARGAQHFAEHKGEGLMPSLDEFRRTQGLNHDGTLPDGAVRVEDL